MISLEIPKRELYLHQISVKAGQTLYWSFSTKKNTIGFGLYYSLKDATEDRIQVIKTLDAESKVSRFQTNPLPRKEKEPNHISSSNSINKVSRLSLSSNNRRSVVERSRTASALSNRDKDKRFSSSEGFDFSLLYDLHELVPIARYDSDKFVIKGSYKVDTPGIYVLFFDNSFSITTSKSLSFSCDSCPQGYDPFAISYETAGYLLKKKRKDLKGFAKRWFVLNQGTLSYFVEPGGVCKGSIDLKSSVVTGFSNRLMFIVDSGSSIYQLKCLEKDDYDKWAQSILKFSHQSILENNREGGGEKAFGSRENLLIDPSKWLDVLKDSILGFNEDVGSLRVKISGLENSLSMSSSSSLAELSRSANEVEEMMSKSEFALNNLKTACKALTDNAELSHQTLQKSFLNLLVGLHSFRRRCSVQAAFENNLGVASPAGTAMDEFFDAQEAFMEDIDDFNLNSCTVDVDDDDDDDGYFVSGDEDTFDELESSPMAEDRNTPEPSSGNSIRRRYMLPSKVVGEDVALLSVLKKSIGKEVGSSSMPISVNEPLNAIQRICEELLYCEILKKAATCTENSLDRLTLVSAFVVSQYGTSAFRGTRKPFNPLLGETYECIREDKGFRFVGEKVSHAPIILAAHTESDDFVLDSCVKPKTSFWGKSLVLNDLGSNELSFPKYGEKYKWNKVSSFVRNLIMGTPYLELVGEVKISNETTKEYAILEFLDGGMFNSRNKNCVRGTVYDCNGNKAVTLQGKWNEGMYKVIDQDKLEILWKIEEPPLNFKDYYGFTKFGIELNELTSVEKGNLPNTDSRLRPDQKLFEEGSLTEAEKIKALLEEKQRSFRRDPGNNDLVPHWFEPRQPNQEPGKEKSEEICFYNYKGGYWEARAEKNFTEYVNLFDLEEGQQNK